MDNPKKAVAQSQFLIDALRNTLDAGLQEIACCLADVLLDSEQQRTLKAALLDLAEDMHAQAYAFGEYQFGDLALAADWDAEFAQLLAGEGRNDALDQNR